MNICLQRVVEFKVQSSRKRQPLCTLELLEMMRKLESFSVHDFHFRVVEPILGVSYI